MKSFHFSLGKMYAAAYPLRMSKTNRITTAQLNAVANLIEDATGAKPDKNSVFSVVIGGLVNEGLEYKTAFEMVFGPGTYDAMVGEIYETLRNAPRKA